MPHGEQVLARRVLNMGGEVNVELFEFGGMKHQRAPHTFDYGIQHFALRVDDLQHVAADFVKAGGKLNATFLNLSLTRYSLKGMHISKYWTAHRDELAHNVTHTFTCQCCGKELEIYGKRDRKYCSQKCYFTSRFGG